MDEQTKPRKQTRERADNVADEPAEKTPVLEHAATYGAITLLLFTLLKAYASANFSLTTAGALLTSAPINVLLGTMVSYSYQIFPLIALSLALWTAFLVARQGWGMLTTATTLGALIALLVSPWHYLWLQFVTVALLAVVFALAAILTNKLKSRVLSSRTREPAEPPWPARNLLRSPTFLSAVVFTAAAWVILESLTNLWLPVEVVVYQGNTTCAVLVNSINGDTKALTTVEADGCRKTVGHVLSEDDNWVTVVSATDRGLRRIPAGAVRYRELCHLTGVQPDGTRPLLWVFSGRPYTSPNTSCRKLADNVVGASLDIGALPGS